MKKINYPVEVITHPQFGEVRISNRNGKIYFCLADICKVLGLENTTRVLSRLAKTGVCSSKVTYCTKLGYNQLRSMTFVNEPNVYRCIFQSRKPEAEKFQNWVFDEVLPQIRKTGGYIPVGMNDDDETILRKALMIVNRSFQKGIKV